MLCDNNCAIVNFVGSSAGSMHKKWCTIILGGILTELKQKQEGCQLVVGIDYEVKDLINEVAARNFEVKTDMVAILAGNDQVKVGMNCNIAKQIDCLIQQVWIIRPTARMFVFSVLPKPTQETASQALIMKVNEGIAAMCRKLNKYGMNTVKYMPLHQSFLEKWKHSDMESGKMRISTRVIQPHGVYFMLGKDRLNHDGALLGVQKVKEIMNEVRMKQESSAPLMSRPGLVVELDNSVKRKRMKHIKGSKPKEEAGSSLRTASRQEHRKYNMLEHLHVGASETCRGPGVEVQEEGVSGKSSLD